MRFTLSLILLCGLNLVGFGQSTQAYVIYNSKGKKVTYAKMIKGFSKADVVMIGEYHDNPISHWLELEITKSLHTNFNLTLGAEMIERDNQDELDLYMQDSITQKGLDTLARLWKNHKTDYKPLVDFAKDSGLVFVATNIPRRYASLVYKKGFDALDTLPDLEKTWMAPLPIAFDSTLPRYQAILAMMGGHGSSRIVKAQAMKDATMAYFILQNFTIDENAKFIHYNGSFHSDFHEGIIWYLLRSSPGINVKSIATVSQSDNSKLSKEHFGRADFIICVDDDMTSTY